ncbi:aminopeptidase P family protein [Taylorella equigenitalis]|uniref:Aminopeptidase P n=1 Tax=Taylorella equigenitalis ATCC 35865 TaxID=743973 RepID=A0ABN4AYD3_9BURK|nr:aminopeptidase P family protein [Taylorella equigenitalis]AFN35605.1 aminopeptidase P [Taylorella equigenitalis ATCC 35865]ASY37561.1 aminopeptidase P family protein [Taylorella equigenitalis]ASY39030.1 Xaa-Pro aminopeptidase [Taylorella equigenitalis]ASY40549.1 Xaa-Pro aminopeptidase [Taylorella equigenitalis]ASY41984.1 Xaa-Pro aminopeptidase [Taylorella equigenitalis]
MNLPKERLSALRKSMKDNNIDIWIVHSADPHLSEYLPNYWQQRVWLSGFTGSVGTVLVTQEFSGLWVDSRYWEQAKNQLQGSGIELMKAGDVDVPTISEYLLQNLQSGGVVGFNPDMVSIRAYKNYLSELSHANFTFKFEDDLIEPLWSDREALPTQQIFEHSSEFYELDASQKLKLVREKLKLSDGDLHLISSLDDVAWILNLRGNDVSYNPVFLSHLAITNKTSILFVDCRKISDDIKKYLEKFGVEIKDYAELKSFLSKQNISKLLVDPDRVAYGSISSFKGEVAELINPSRLMKSRKSDKEIQFVREAMEQDGAALCEFFSWFEKAIKKENITELTIDEKLIEFRSKRKGYVSPSFATIAGFNANGAMPHYRATEESYSEIKGNGFLLIDSGAQYLGGTTDITRVIPVGEVSADQCSDYTYVLKAHIQLALAEFPVAYPSPLLDTIARAPLWKAGLDYGHGTGHGVGYFLNVHEGPQVIAHRAYKQPYTELYAGMITSNEPGVYRPGKWGVRIENLIANIPSQKTEFVETLKFETLTLCPIETSCVVRDLLDEQEVVWLNEYHKIVQERLSKHLSGDALEWLNRKTKAI